MSEPSPTLDEWVLCVNRSELIRAFRTVGRIGRAISEAEAILIFDGGKLFVDLAGVSTRLPASGTWPPEVRVWGGALRRFIKALPVGDPLRLHIAGGRLSVARFSIPCQWRDASPPTPVRDLVAPNADLFEILLIPSRCSHQEIDAAGAGPLIADAQERLLKLCSKAAHLVSRYGISASDLEVICRRHTEEGSRQFREADRPTIRQIAGIWELLAPLGVEIDEIRELMNSRLKSAWKQ